MSAPKQLAGPSSSGPSSSNTSPRGQDMNPSAKGAIPPHVKIANGRSNSPARTTISPPSGGGGQPLSPTPGNSAINWDAINRDPRNPTRNGQTSPEGPRYEDPSSPMRNISTPPPKQPPGLPPPSTAAIGKTTPIKRNDSDSRPVSMPPVSHPDPKPKLPPTSPPPLPPASPKIVFRDDKIKAKPGPNLAPIASPPPAAPPSKPIPTFGMQMIVGQIPPPQTTNPLIRSHTAPGIAGRPTGSLHASHDGGSKRKTVQIVDPGFQVMATHIYQQRLVTAKATADAEVTSFANEMRSFQEFARSEVLRTLSQFATKFVALNVKDITGADCRKYVTEIMSLLKTSKRASSRLSSHSVSPVGGGRTLTPAEERAVSKMLLIISQFSRIASAAVCILMLEDVILVSDSIRVLMQDEQENDASIVDYLSQQAALTGAASQYNASMDMPAPAPAPKPKTAMVVCRLCERQVAKVPFSELAKLRQFLANCSCSERA
jgi:hypothetical protein